MTKNEERFEQHSNLLRKKESVWPLTGDEHVQYLFRFDNGYGASVVKGFGTYGYENDLWELAVIKFNKDDGWDIVCDTDITNDVLGWLSVEEVLETLDSIKNL